MARLMDTEYAVDHKVKDITLVRGITGSKQVEPTRGQAVTYTPVIGAVENDMDSGKRQREGLLLLLRASFVMPRYASCHHSCN